MAGDDRRRVQAMQILDRTAQGEGIVSRENVSFRSEGSQSLMRRHSLRLPYAMDLICYA